jgi:D-sedoheptulose 7-phosphate isomerase
MGSRDRSASIIAKIEENIAIEQLLLRDSRYLGTLSALALAMSCALRAGNKVLVFGNGGSAAQAQHIAAELAGRLQKERPSLSALALTANVSLLTALGNDYGFEQIFARQVAGLGAPGDVALGISTSGNSQNVIEALNVAREKGLVTAGFTGRGGKLTALVDHCVCIPADCTPRIQEAHLLTGHILCEILDDMLAARRVSESGYQ